MTRWQAAILSARMLQERTVKPGCFCAKAARADCRASVGYLPSTVKLRSLRERKELAPASELLLHADGVALAGHVLSYPTAETDCSMLQSRIPRISSRDKTTGMISPSFDSRV